jgi:hypothetical protein
VVIPGFEVRLCGNSILLNPPKNLTIMPTYVDDDTSLLCYRVKHLFYIPPVFVMHMFTVTKVFTMSEQNRSKSSARGNTKSVGDSSDVSTNNSFSEASFGLDGS